MPDRIDEALQGPLVVINVGLRKFAESFERQGVDVTQVDWIPPAAGDQEMISLLDRLL